MKDYLDLFSNPLLAEQVRQIRKERSEWRNAPNLDLYRQAIESAPHIEVDSKIYDQPAVTFKTKLPLDELTSSQLRRSLEALVPWKKGPFSLFDIEIDSEWRSHLKWERLLPSIKSLEGQRIADIGCHNGYFMYRMLHENPAFVVGFEPVARHLLTFELLQSYAKEDRLYFELLGAEHIHLYEKFFDRVFCLGILYHHTDPMDLLRKIHTSLNTGGQVIIDCQGIEGDQPIALMPQSRYASAKGIWWLPTKTCLIHWLRRAKFRDINLFYAEKLDSNEQRSTPWAPVASLSSFLDPSDPSLTVEGYPAPWRFYVTATK
jgi:tRNA (mo5U34)-methyltransferase